MSDPDRANELDIKRRRLLQLSVAATIVGPQPLLWPGSAAASDSRSAGDEQIFDHGFEADGVAWSIPAAVILSTGRNTRNELATNVPLSSIVTVSPDLLPDQRLEQTGNVLNLVSGNELPTVNGSLPGDLLDAISARSWRIEVMDSPLATFRNLRTNTTYGKGHNDTTWWQCMLAAQDGDIIEISPGAINETEADCSNYYSNSLDSCGMTIVKGVTIRNIAGRGRWRLFPAGLSIASNRNGIGIFSPTDGDEISGRLNIVIEGFDLTDQFLTHGAGVRIRSAPLTAGSWNGYHASLTLRDFKIGRTTGRSLSGISGSAELMMLENGHVFDCGDGSGQEHNLYVGARVFEMRGVRVNRTRGWASLPAWTGNETLEGHLLKLSAVTGTIEGCSIDCATRADQSLLLQMKAGGNWTVRGNLFKDSAYPNNANGMINMCREMSANGTTPNYEWWAGSAGNSLDFQRNLILGHYPRPILWFFASNHASALQPAVGGSYSAAQRLQSMLVRDNIAMVTAVPAQWMLNGFPGTNNGLWIFRDPNAGADWGARNNSALTYTLGEHDFEPDERALLSYRRRSGPVAATGGNISTHRFVYPHGSMARVDSDRGLG